MPGKGRTRAGKTRADSGLKRECLKGCRAVTVICSFHAIVTHPVPDHDDHVLRVRQGVLLLAEEERVIRGGPGYVVWT